MNSSERDNEGTALCMPAPRQKREDFLHGLVVNPLRPIKSLVGGDSHLERLSDLFEQRWIGMFGM